MSKKETEDMGFDIYDPNANAIFLPSISSIYVTMSSMYEHKMYNQDLEAKPWLIDRNPAGLSKEGKELNFLDEDNGAFYYPYALYSAGHSDLNVETNYDKILEKESMIRSRDKNKTIIVGDSGGYQIGRGLLKFDWDNIDSEENDTLRTKILKWLECTADYSMTLDIPVFGIDIPQCEGVTSFGQCLEHTLYNNDYFVKHRTPGATKFLNVLHGRSQSEIETWWDAVKDYPFEGWAFSSLAANIKMLLKRLIVMRDEGYINDDKNWIHILGVSSIEAACVFSSLQRTLRRHVHPKATISFDAASPFLAASKGQIYQGVKFNSKKWGISTNAGFESYTSLVNSKIPFPIESAIGSKLVMGDICIKHETHTDTKGRPWKRCADAFSYMYVMNHNVYTHLKGIKEANNLNQLPAECTAEWMPGYIQQFKEVCEEVFTSDNPNEVIEANTRLFDNLSKTKLARNSYNSAATDNFFTFD